MRQKDTRKQWSCCWKRAQIRIFADTYFGQTPLIWGAQDGLKETVKLLFEKGADWNAADIEERRTLLI